MQEYIKNLFDTKNVFVAPAVIVGVCVILCGFIIQMTAGNIANKDQSITVTGSYEKVVKSDVGKLTINLNERVFGDIGGALTSKKVTDSQIKVLAYLKKAGFEEVDIENGNLSLSPICELNNQGYENCSIGVKGQIGSQTITVNSKNIELIKSLSGKVYSEINGVNIQNVTAEYLFNGLKDIRVEMLTEATKNAKERAEAVAKAGGASVGSISSLSSGVFQVTAPNSVNVDDYGTYDTSTIDKKVTATVKANFSIR